MAWPNLTLEDVLKMGSMRPSSYGYDFPHLLPSVEAMSPGRMQALVQMQVALAHGKGWGNWGGATWETPYLFGHQGDIPATMSGYPKQGLQNWDPRFMESASKRA